MSIEVIYYILILLMRLHDYNNTYNNFCGVCELSLSEFSYLLH